MKVRKSIILIILLLLLMFIGSAFPKTTYFILAMAIFVGIILAKESVKNRGYMIPFGIIILLSFQNLSIGCGAHLFGNFTGYLKYMTQIPFMIICVNWIFIFLNQFKNRSEKLSITTVYFILIVASILFSICFGIGNINSVLMNIRNMTTFFFVYEIGKYHLYNKENLDKFVVDIFKLSYVILLFGIVLLIKGYDLYEAIGIQEVYYAKGSESYGQLNGRFTSDLFGISVNRMGSIYYEPVNLAYYFAASTILSLFYSWTNSRLKKYVNIVFMAIGLFLTFGKGGYIIVFWVIICKIIELIYFAFIKESKNKNLRKVSVYTAGILIFIFILFYTKYIGGAVMPHFWAIQGTWKSILKAPFGHGLGTGGNMAHLFGGTSETWLSSGGETALLSYGYQLGIHGMIVIALCIISMKNKENKDIFSSIMYYVPYAILIVSIMQDNAFTPQCITIFMLMLGAINSVDYQK